MKRFLILAILATFMLSAGVANAAVTLKTSGEMAFDFGWWDNTNFYDSDKDNQQEDDLMAAQRTRIYFDWSASETLRGVIGFEFGTAIWGNQAGGADLDADERALEIKHNYIDFTVPNTALAVRMGIQPVVLPGNFGSPILDVDVAGILTTYKFNDMFSASLGWFRPKNANAGGTEGVIAKNDEIDAIALLLPIKGDGFQVTPWAMYALQGQNASTTGNDNLTAAANANMISPTSNGTHDNVDAWWVGASAKLTMFDPFEILADVIYGKTDTNNSRFEREGWFLDLAVNYKLSWGTPGLFFVYTTGNDDDPSNGSENIPGLGNGNALATMATSQSLSALKISSFGFAGSYGNLADWDAAISGSGTEGFMIIGGQIANMKFIDKLSHTLRVLYGQGTNDPDLVKKGYGNWYFQNSAANAATAQYNFLTTKDNFWEVNFDHTYAIYENLTAVVEMGYINMNLDDDTWKGHSTNFLGAYRVIDPTQTQDAWKLALCLTYKF